MPDEAFSKACAFVIQVGVKHRDKTIARVGSSDQGLVDLDWMRGQVWCRGPLKAAINTYLEHPAVSRLLDAALDGDDD